MRGNAGEHKVRPYGLQVLVGANLVFALHAVRFGPAEEYFGR